MKFKLHHAIVAGLVLAGTVSANPLTFGGFTGTFPYVENGLSVTASQTPPPGAWNVTAPATLGVVAYLNSPPYTPGAPGTINVSGGLFHFSSVDFSCGPVGGEILGPVTFAYSITGMLNGSTVFSATATLASLTTYSPAEWTTVDGDPAALMDSLAITLRTTSSGGVFATGYALRNLDLTRVPDATTTASLLGATFGALAFWRQVARGSKRK